MVGECPIVNVKYQDLRRDIIVDCYFECADDMIKYFSSFNPDIIHILEIDAYFHEDNNDKNN